MDQAKSTRPPSGLPRLSSRIPLPTYHPSKSIKPSPSRERLQADPGVDVARLRRPSEETLFKKPLLRPSSPTRQRESSGRKQTSHRGNGERGDRAEDGWDSDTGVDIHYQVETPASRVHPCWIGPSRPYLASPPHHRPGAGSPPSSVPSRFPCDHHRARHRR
jgi:hypothetical protein